jgi:hypothetical protein
MLSCLTILSCPRCGSGNLKNRNITQHASYLILHGSKHIVPFIKRHIGKEGKVQFIDGQLTLLFSSAARTFHTTANVTSHKCDSGYKLSKNLFGTFSLFPYMVLFTSIKIQKKFLKNSQKPKMQKPSNNINNSFWSELYSSSLMTSMLKSYISHVLVLFSDVMDGFGSSFSPHFSTCMLTASNKSSNNTLMRESVVDIVLLNDVSLEFAKCQIILYSLIKHKLSIFGWFLATKFFNPVQMYLK